MEVPFTPKEPIYRLVSTRVPRIDPYQGLYDSDSEFEELIELDNLTNSRIQDLTSALPFLPVDKRATGKNSKILNAPFVYFSTDRKTRFSNGTHGVYYASFSEETSIREVAYHLSKFYSSTNEPDLLPDYEFWISKIILPVFPIDHFNDFSKFLTPDNYSQSQIFALEWKDRINGLTYPSVRHCSGTCIALFLPIASSLPRKGKTVKFNWNGEQQEMTWYHLISKSNPL